jgi:phosphoglycolate phosphatase
MVGDSSNDAKAAHAAGCPVVLVTYGYNHGQRVQDTPAAAWLDTLADLPEHLSATRR